MRPLLTAIALSLACVASHANSVPTEWLNVNITHALHAIVVADVAAGASLPQPDECNKGQVICLDGSFWYRADVRATLSGTVSDQHLNVVTSSHRGMAAFLRDPGPRLLALETLGDRIVMPKYRSLPLAERRDGELFLVDYDDSWPTWLPCAMQSLREPLDATAFAANLRVAPAEYERWGVDERRDLYVIARDGATPRFGIAVSRLRQLLATLKARSAPTDCPRPETD